MKMESLDRGNEISLKELISKLNKTIKYLVSKWKIILLMAFLGGLIGYIFAYLKKPSYTAITTFVLEGDESSRGLGGLSQYAGLASMAGIDIGGGGTIFQGENIIELYKSRNMIEKTLLSSFDDAGRKKLLIDKFIQFNNLAEKWKKKENLKNLQFLKRPFSRVQDSIISDLVEEINKHYLTISKPDKKLNIIKVEVKAANEVFAKVFNDQIVKNVNDFYVKTKTKKSLQNVQILQQKTDSVRAVMNGAIYQAAMVTDETPNLNLTRQVQRIVPVQKSQVSVETNRLILSELVKNLELSKIGLRKEMPLIQIIDSPVYPIKKTILSKLVSVIIGGFIFSFFTVIGLIFKKIVS